MKTIAIDIDNVLAQSAISFVEQSNALFNSSITLEDYSENWSQMWGVSNEEAERRGTILRDHQIQKHYMPVEGAVGAINQLSRNFKIVLVTSRRKQAEQLTREWLTKYFDHKFDEIIFANFWDDIKKSAHGYKLHKGELYQAIGADFVIDDHLKHCLAAVEQGAQAILFGDYPWNQKATHTSGMTRCVSWAEVQEYFNGIATS